MRTIPAQALGFLQSHYGTEPIFILEVAWSGLSTQRIAYSDQKIDGMDYPYPTLVDMGGFDTSLKLTGSSDSQSTSITLDDIDGHLKTLLNTHDIQKCPCWIYQSFKGIPYSQKILLFCGEVTSPIVWTEGDRTLQFDIVTKTTDAEVAFSMEDGDFPMIPEDALGQVWPLVFGTVCHMEAVQVRSPRKGYLAKGEGIHDFTIEPRICQAHFLECKNVVINSYEVQVPPSLVTSAVAAYYMNLNLLRPSDPQWTCTVKMGTGGTSGGGYGGSETWYECRRSDQATSYTQYVYGIDSSCVEDRYITICELEDLLDQQKAFEHPVLTITGGDKFPQGQSVTLNIEGAQFIGIFSGESFAVLDRKHPDYDTANHVLCHAVETVYNSHYELARWDEDAWVLTSDNQTYYVPQTLHSSEVCTATPVWVSVAEDGVSASQKAFDDMPTGTFCWLPAGSEVFLEGETEVLYIVSLIPGTVNSVAAYKKQETTGRELLMTIPTDLYTVYETDYTGYTVVEIGFDKKLSDIDDTWNDEIYVSFTSDVGPNPIDIIDWLITKYTSLTFDPVSKAYVKTRLANYPNNFWVKEKLNVMQLIQDIAYQSRCAIYIRNEVVFIVYLSEEPTSLKTLTESDIVANTFKIKLSDSGDLVTKYTATWKATEAGVVKTDSIENKIILKYNIAKYGVNEEETDYYTQNIYSTILKSATFWLIRLANTWKQVEFDTPLTMLDLDLFDCVTLNVAQLSSVPVKIIVTGLQYNNQDNTVHFEGLTPIRSGESTPYTFFWPADIDPANLFPPTAEEANAGAGYSFVVTPPIGHILRGGDVVLEDEASVILSAGDPYPSDLDDTLPTVVCKISDVMDIVEPDPVIEALALAKKALEASSGHGGPAPAQGPAGGPGEKPCSQCGIACNELNTVCTWQVSVSTITVWASRLCGHLACGDSAGGSPCTGLVKSCCYSFGSRASAAAFRNEKLSEMAAQVYTCPDGSIVNPGPIQSVSQVDVRYGSSMDQTEPLGGWDVDQETDLCSGLYVPDGGNSLGDQCTCVAAILGGGPVECP